MNNLWMVVRTGDNGHTVLVKDGLTQQAAKELWEILTERGHKQFYDVYEYTEETRSTVIGNHKIIV